MTTSAPRILKYILFGFAVLAALILLFVNKNLATFAEWAYPGSAIWTHAALLGVEFLGLFWLWRGIFGGHKHLLLVNDASEEGRRKFAAELARRMKANPHIRKAGIVPGDDTEEAYLAKCMAHLREKADEEIRQNAKRVFLATALCQNGRLDALLVFASLCRLIWRISSIYNQRPHPREVASLYWVVVTSTFLALSLEEIDLSTEITVGFGQAFHAMLPAGMASSIPFAGKALHTFTSSAIDGTANCYLALRAGIITRNAYAYGAEENRPARATIYREAGVILLEMSNNLMDKLAGTVAETVAGTVRNVQDKTVQAGKGLVGGLGTGFGLPAGISSMGRGLGSSAEKLATGTMSAMRATGNGIVRAGTLTTNAVNTAFSTAANTTMKILAKPFTLPPKDKDSAE